MTNVNTSPTSDSSDRERLFLPALLLAGILLGLGLGIWAWSPAGSTMMPAATSSAYAAITPAPAPVVNAPAPDFLLRDPDGRAVQLSGLRGAPVAISFWATWCEPCRIEMPELNSEAARVKVLAINFGESSDTAVAYAQELKLNAVTILLDPDFSVRDMYRVSGLPATFLVDASGVIRFLKIGSFDTSEFDAALAAPGGSH